MGPTEFSADTIIALLRKQTIASLSEVMAALGARASRRTAFRKLKDIDARTSYSHRGGFYTLDELAHFDERGLWSFAGVRFSRAGTLIATANSFVNHAEAGHFVEELDNLLGVGTQDALRKLVGDGRLTRHKLAAQFLYCVADRTHQQELAERDLSELDSHSHVPAEEVPGLTRSSRRVRLDEMNGRGGKPQDGSAGPRRQQHDRLSGAGTNAAPSLPYGGQCGNVERSRRRRPRERPLRPPPARLFWQIGVWAGARSSTSTGIRAGVRNLLRSRRPPCTMMVPERMPPTGANRRDSACGPKNGGWDA